MTLLTWYKVWGGWFIVTWNVTLAVLTWLRISRYLSWISSVFLRWRDILVECYCVSLWQTRYIGSTDCRPHDGGSMSDGTFSWSFGLYGTYDRYSPSRGSNRKSPTLTSHRSDSLTRGKCCGHTFYRNFVFTYERVSTLMSKEVNDWWHKRFTVT